MAEKTENEMGTGNIPGVRGDFNAGAYMRTNIVILHSLNTYSMGYLKQTTK